MSIKTLEMNEKWGEVFSDPLIVYGYGVIAFFKLVKTLIFIFGLISLILAIPQMICYIHFSQYQLQDSISIFFHTTLAQTGDSYPNPFLVPLKLNRLFLTCESSQIYIDEQLE